MPDQIVVPTSAEHPLGDGSGAVVAVDPGAPAPGGATPRQKLGLILFIIGITLGAVVAFRLSLTGGLAYMAVLAVAVGASLSYAPDEEV